MYHWEVELDQNGEYVYESGLYWDSEDCLADAKCFCEDHNIKKCTILVIGGCDLDHDFQQFEYLA